MASSKIYEAVLVYLREQNRPYSTNDVVANLHNDHGKAAVQKTLDLLVADGKITEKLNGKQKAYVIDQSSLPAASDAELAAADAEINALTEGLKQIQEMIRGQDVKKRKLMAEPTDEEIATETASLQTEIATLEARLESLSSNQTLVSKDEKTKITKDHEKGVKEWRKRKRMCLDITDAILESYPKSKKILFEDVGIETDEDVGVKMPTV